MITQTYNLNLIPNKVPVIVNASQYDKTSRTLNFNIYNGDVLFTIPSGSTVTVRGTKPDKTGFEYPCTFNGSVISFNIQDQMTVISGKIPVEIRIVNNGEILGTANFILFVEQTTLTDDTIISETDLPLLESAEQNAIRAEEAADRAESVVSDIEADLANKQDKLVSGTNIKTLNNVSLLGSGNIATPTGIKGNAESSYRTGNVNLTPENIGLTVTRTTTIADVITADTNFATIISVEYVQYGKIAQLYIRWQNKTVISAPIDGDFEDIRIGTLVSGKRAKLTTMLFGVAWGTLYFTNTSGELFFCAIESVGTVRTIPANTTFGCCATYILQ